MRNLNEPPRIEVPERALAEFLKLAAQYPVSDWDFEDWPYGEIRPGATFHLSQLAGKIEDATREEGFAVVDISHHFSTLQSEALSSISTLILSSLGTPLRVFWSHPFWRRLNVDLERPPAKSCGTGESPQHMDFVNTENPPDLVCLLCIRPDPLGGGTSLVSEIAGIEASLSTHEVEILSRHQFRDGRVFNLEGVGQDINPFPIFALDEHWKYRYTGNLLLSPPNEDARLALQSVSSILNTKVVSFTLARGELLILDQHKVTHARGALALGQESVPESRRRLLLQSFVRQAKAR